MLFWINAHECSAVSLGERHHKLEGKNDAGDDEYVRLENID